MPHTNQGRTLFAMTARYSINDLEKITGIKAHTIRIWEKRYKVVTPERTKTNIRYYLDRDLKRLLNISTLNKHGIKISHIVRMPEEEIREKVVEINSDVHDHESQINSLVVAMIEFNEIAFERVLTDAIRKIGFETTVTHIIYPFLEKIGVLWQIGTINPAQEHFIVGLIRARLIVAIDGKGTVDKGRGKTFLLYLPEGELHEMGLLFYQFLLKSAGHQVIYLGQSLPYRDMLSVTRIRPVDYVFTYFIAALKPDEISSYLKDMARDLDVKKIFIAGLQISDPSIPIPEKVIPIQNADAFRDLLPSL